MNSQSEEKEKETDSEPDLLENQHSFSPASTEDTGCMGVSPVVVQILVIEHGYELWLRYVVAILH